MRTKSTNRVANKDAWIEVAGKREFEGSNMWAQWENNLYVVYSYGFHFPMYAYDLAMDEWVGNKDKYSSSTTRQQSQARPPMNTQIMHLNTSEMHKLIKSGGVTNYLFNCVEMTA